MFLAKNQALYPRENRSKDDMFLECAALSNADVLVTGDKDLLSLGNNGNTRFITPSEYVAMAA